MLGGIRITPLLVLKTAMLLLVALWAAAATSNSSTAACSASALTPSIQVLIGKLIRMA